MQSAPNQTVVKARVIAYAPAPDAQGGEVSFEVLANETLDKSSDFIRPSVGLRMNAYYPDSDLRSMEPVIGATVTICMKFMGGPSGGRPIVENLKRR